MSKGLYAASERNKKIRKRYKELRETLVPEECIKELMKEYDYLTYSTLKQIATTKS